MALVGVLGRWGSFQVNGLLRHPNTPENGTLAVAEGEGIGDDLARPAGRHRRVIEEAFALLDSLGLAEDALRPVNTLAYGGQRLIEIAVALGLAPKVLLLDQPAAGVPSSETHLVAGGGQRPPADTAAFLLGHD